MAGFKVINVKEEAKNLAIATGLISVFALKVTGIAVKDLAIGTAKVSWWITKSTAKLSLDVLSATAEVFGNVSFSDNGSSSANGFSLARDSFDSNKINDIERALDNSNMTVNEIRNLRYSDYKDCSADVRSYIEEAQRKF